MNKCKRCGNVIKLRAVTLSDGYVCYKCFEELGFQPSDRKYHTHTSYDEIKCGKSAYIENLIETESAKDAKRVAEQLGFRIAHYGDEREIDATDEELEIFDTIKGMIVYPSDQLRLVRKSDNYVTVMFGDWDLARFKYTDRAKWIAFPVVEKGTTKHYIEDPAEASDFADMVTSSLSHIVKYSSR